MSGEQRYPAERLVAYDSTWVERYAELATPLAEALGPGWVLEHVGSTSVPGLVAKPVIDIAMAPPPGGSLGEVMPVMRDLGWSGPVGVGDHRAVFLLDGSLRTAIGHVFTSEQWPSAHVRLFAEWLRFHDQDRDEYARLKAGLVGDGVWGSDYTQRKTDFVVSVVNRARAAKGLPAAASL